MFSCGYNAPMARERAFTLDTPHGTRLDGVLHLPEASGKRPCIVICHGFKGFMDWGFFPYLAELLAERGFAAVRFNFSGSGMQPGEDQVSDLEAFRHAKFTDELRDLLAMLDHVATALAPRRIDPERIGLFGHSRGGGTAALASGHADWRDRIRALVTWAAVSTFERFSDEELAGWRRDGELLVVNSRTGQELLLDIDVLEDLETNADTLDIRMAAGRRMAPWLIVHGEADETVCIQDALILYERGEKPVELHRIPGATHTFNVGHPFQHPSRELIHAMNVTQIWFRQFL